MGFVPHRILRGTDAPVQPVSIDEHHHSSANDKGANGQCEKKWVGAHGVPLVITTMIQYPGFLVEWHMGMPCSNGFLGCLGG